MSESVLVTGRSISDFTAALETIPEGSQVCGCTLCSKIIVISAEGAERIKGNPNGHGVCNPCAKLISERGLIKAIEMSKLGSNLAENTGAGKRLLSDLLRNRKP